MPYSFKDYQRVFDLRQLHLDEISVKQRELDQEYIARIESDFKAANKRKKWSRGKVGPNGDLLMAQFRVIADEWLDSYYYPVGAQLEALLNHIAQVVIPDTIAELEQVDWVYAGAYRSQGFGCHKYTREAAESKANMIRYQGFTAEVRPLGVVNKFDSSNSPNYGVFANVSKEGYDLLRRKPAQPLREWIKSCWKRGVNPRVYNPFLPHDIEDKLGLDYFGNDKIAAA